MLHNAMNMGFFMKALFTLAFSYYMHTEFEFKYRPTPSFQRLRPYESFRKKITKNRDSFV